MKTIELLDALDYSTSASFVSAARLSGSPEQAHTFRRAISSCRLVGSFSLKAQNRSSDRTPVIFVAEASSDKEANDIHRRVWNQNITPFLLVRTPQHLRLYSGFEYAPAPENGQQGGVLDGLIPFSEVLSRLSAFRASAIEDGSLWRVWGPRLRPDARVDWKLLGNLKELGKILHDDNLKRTTAHALIGKFVYLRYLRDRGILSDRKLEEWRIKPETIFSNQFLTLDALEQLIVQVEDWLNGSVFPLSFSEIRQEHLREVAGVFLGDDAATRQLHLDFQAYDFSHIPIETLSIIYEQFLKIEGKDKLSGAYYTPLTVVNFMLAELDAIRPLKRGMKVLDPACGSGAFLVQCYRRLAEKHMRETKGHPRPAVLRDLLEEHIFGLDHDADACRVAELSLILTMLDYIDPPDLTSITSKFKLPNLHNKNIFEADFFDPGSTWATSEDSKSYAWIVGNPPWHTIKAKAPAGFAAALKWISEHRSDKPAVQNEAAEAFAWKVTEHCGAGGAIGMLLPAVTLFRTNPKFRRAFFSGMDVHSVANFANLREVLFARRARMPAAAIFYRPSTNRDARDPMVYSPLVVNQEANRPKPAKRQNTWAIVLNASEVRRIPAAEVASGDTLPWKLALWGSHRDAGLLRTLENRFDSLKSFLRKNEFVISQGLELRERGSDERIEPVPEVSGKLELDIKALRKRGRIHTLPKDALRRVKDSRAYVREGRGVLPLAVCRAPHVIVSADRRFSVYSGQFVVVPPRQIGIAGPKRHTDDLKMLALFLSSSFCQYHEFIHSPQLGVRDGRSTLDVLQRVPTPIADLSSDARREWLQLHEHLTEGERAAESEEFALNAYSASEESPRFTQQLIDSVVSAGLGLTAEEQFLIDDLVRIRMPLVDGRVAGPAVKPPTSPELRDYAKTLESALNAFTDGSSDGHHEVHAVMSGAGGVAEIAFASTSKFHGLPATRHARSEEEGRLRTIFAELSKRHGQWLYFDRNLFVHINERSYILKPAQLLWWSRSQALADADEMIASFA